MKIKVLNILAGLATLTSVLLGAAQVVNAEQGTGSWYGSEFAGSPTANGETFNPGAMTAAHHNLPFGTQVRVTNLNNGASVVVRINDRLGHGGRVIDLSEAAAGTIGMIDAGVAPVQLEVLN
jgi:rare lipoprotein A